MKIQLIDKSQQEISAAERELRVVDYREEIVSLYGAFLEFLNEKHVEISDEMTAREIENLLVSTGEFDPESVQKVADCFERAEYSMHPIRRKDYETIYTSLTELEFDADKTT